jgi:hypothetical protein
MTQTWQWLLAVAGGIVVLAAALVAIAKGFGVIDRGMKRANEFLDDWRGEPRRPGYPARPGVPERLERIEISQARTEVRLDNVEAQLTPANGAALGTLRETVDRIEQTVVPPDAAPTSPA